MKVPRCSWDVRSRESRGRAGQSGDSRTATATRLSHELEDEWRC
jgi:hypothetical protein